MKTLTHVSSSAVEAMALEGDVLYVRFNSGRTYAYTGVTQTLYRTVLQGSIGQNVNTLIKGHFPEEEMHSDDFVVSDDPVGGPSNRVRKLVRWSELGIASALPV